MDCPVCDHPMDWLGVELEDCDEYVVDTYRCPACGADAEDDASRVYYGVLGVFGERDTPPPLGTRVAAVLVARCWWPVRGLYDRWVRGLTPPPF